MISMNSACRRYSREHDRNVGEKCIKEKRAWEVLPVGGRVGLLHYIVPSPPDKATSRLVAVVSVMVGYNNRMRAFTVFEKTESR